MHKVVEIALRVFGALTALAGMVYGGLILVIFFFVGQAAGFADPQYAIKYLLAVLYVAVTVYVAVTLALRASTRRAALLALLVAPVLILFLVAPDYAALPQPSE
ncbi:hypothetical protein F1654_09770 [Alkalicaulis satelles]|uniref:DUF4064 domain-containing protein n=1 Tax=Alkalicaulis satelles TaxID=2609175 RepID=A0A5M6ZJZ2_9PROT|nr:hypothetical protein [Alkalicaulis satelles]KAA5804054.1 hypothetical protein F1654_09770 [Alkalicaulis satelles]